MSSVPIIVVDDEVTALTAVETILESVGYTNVRTCTNPDHIWDLMPERGGAVVLLDIMMPGTGGEEILAGIKQVQPETQVIMVSGINEIGTAVRCIKKGAYDYLVKPIEVERLITSVRNAVELYDLHKCNQALSDSLLHHELRVPEAFSDLTTRTSSVQSIFKYLEAVAVGSSPVLITGETGVGKELFARAVHKASGRSGPFVAVNIAGLSDDLLADTLFGHVRGAFTGAGHIRQGLIERAEGGTLFLDEIGDLSLASQVTLLRVIQEREYSPVGSDIEKKCDARIVTATSKSISDMQASTTFRRDLFYRLKTHHVHIPPLRERKDDIPLLVQSFLASACAEYNKPIPHVPHELYVLLDNWHFPGNIRELRAMVFDAVAGQKGNILSLHSFKKAIGIDVESHSDYRLSFTKRKGCVTFHETLPTFKEIEQLLLEEAMDRVQGNRSLAADLLGVSRQAISQRVKKKH